MYAINHAATALLIKKNKPELPLWPLLISVQLVEIGWVIFNYLGIEHYSVTTGKLHLDFLPYSHSVFSGVLAALLSYVILTPGFKNRKLAIAFAIGVLSHIAIDLIFHEHDIRLFPFAEHPVWGLGIIKYPLVNFILELLYGIGCWWYFGGNKKLLAVIIIFNLADLPTMFASGDALNPLKLYPFILPTFILIQILLTWYFVWRYARQKPVGTRSSN
ncbi:hypothetical protein A4D02_26960 [Niastella koreensis]|uniref:Membrane-bound metal-dependent hydrolase n=2 Tax=Niastella koreensis TaxID=354356 RepID=G8TFP5_NIAKG|nr:hypothetical protein [Niastella koreensis]AEV99484.1 hypothetical protein Niako_3154 [Niastella koreensis GR20-10]OQP50223.1 hypothetical protein A4D02_26960 [Niastella koreensis]